KRTLFLFRARNSLVLFSWAIESARALLAQLPTLNEKRYSLLTEDACGYPDSSLGSGGVCGS
ncbi:MAG: hypothetical protein Q4F84_03915, partial [Fibrobacter sp.]|nr:hypothetical protein [Fibrobacter sp.]